MSVNSGPGKGKMARPKWYKTISKYEKPDLWRAVWQLVNTFVPYFFLLYLMYRTIKLGYSYWVTILLAIVVAGLMVRIFIFLHDCGHGSFFASKRANAILGNICGILTFTAHADWRHAHGVHHATVGNLDRRGGREIWMLTVNEYLGASKLKRFAYRFFRNPLVLFGLGPAYSFLISNRLPHTGFKRSERYSVHFTNLAILTIIALASLTIGFRAYVLIQLPILLIGGTIGLWLFYIQHQFEGTYWARHDEWDLMKAALHGSSYYKLPRVLQWFTGNIGLHHIHHIRPRIPNYNLQRCLDATPELQAVEPLTIRKSLKSLLLKLWDEDQKKLVGFRFSRGTAAEEVGRPIKTIN